jgi:hypothetical protein
MGCDIHAYVETQDPRSDSWSYVGEHHFSRNYLFFALAAGARRYTPWPDSDLLEKALTARGVKTLDDPKLSSDETDQIVIEACDTGITSGQPSFREKGIPKDLSYQVVDHYTMTVVEDDEDDGEEPNLCKRKTADSWITSGSSVVWELDNEGKVYRVTNPDWHTPSWLSTDEMQTLTERFDLALEERVAEAKTQQEISLRWANSGLEKAKKEGDAESIKFFEREVKREAKWSTHDPRSDNAFISALALVAMMRAYEARGVKARLVFWFDN